MSAAARWRPFAALLLMSLAWGYTWIAIKQALAWGGPFDFAAHRALLAVPLLFAILVWLRRPLRPVGTRWLLALGLFQTTLWSALMSASLVAGAAGTSSILAYTMPFWVLLLAWPLLGERLRGWQWLAVALAGCGLLLVVAPWRTEATPLSSALAVLAGFVWGVSAIIAKRMRRVVELDLWSINFWNTLFGTVGLVLLAVVVPEPPAIWHADYLFGVLYSGVALVICWWLWLYALEHLPAPIAGLGALLTPVFALALAAIELGERPHAGETAGMALILGALALLSWLGWRAARTAHRRRDEGAA